MRKGTDNMNRKAFIDAYLEKVRNRYAWAKDDARLAGFRDAVERTLDMTNGATWAWDAPMSHEAFREIGGKGKMTLKALRALPKEESKT